MFRIIGLALLFIVAASGQTTDVVQNDTASTAVNCGTCSSGICGTGSIDNPRQMAQGGAAGSSAATETHPAATNDLMIAFFEDPNGINASCDAGTATTRLNVTTAGLFTVTEICVCQGTTELGAATGLSISLNSTGVKTQTVTISADAGCSSNPVRVIYCGNTGGLHGGESYQFTPDQSHTLPTVAATRSRAVVVQ